MIKKFCLKDTSSGKFYHQESRYPFYSLVPTEHKATKFLSADELNDEIQKLSSAPINGILSNRGIQFEKHTIKIAYKELDK